MDVKVITGTLPVRLKTYMQGNPSYINMPALLVKKWYAFI